MEWVSLAFFERHDSPTLAVGDTATVDGVLLESNAPLPVSTSTSAYKHEELRGRMFATPRTEAMNMITYCPDESCAVGRLEKKLLRPCPHFEVGT